jgi:hypothetical protein
MRSLSRDASSTEAGRRPASVGGLPKKLLMSWVGRRELAAIVVDARRWHWSIHRVIELRSQTVEKQTKFFTLTVGHAEGRG